MNVQLYQSNSQSFKNYDICTHISKKCHEVITITLIGERKKIFLFLQIEGVSVGRIPPNPTRHTDKEIVATSCGVYDIFHFRDTFPPVGVTMSHKISR